jgi:hypothetical protein
MAITQLIALPEREHETEWEDETKWEDETEWEDETKWEDETEWEDEGYQSKRSQAANACSFTLRSPVRQQVYASTRVQIVPARSGGAICTWCEV